jgi:hypothetical protein
MDKHITIAGTYSFTVISELADLLVSEFPDKVEITEQPEDISTEQE